MASIKKRGEYSYRITVSAGRNPDGSKISFNKTVKLEPGLTEKQRTAELNRLAVMFENDVLLGNVYSGNITLIEFVDKWLKEYAEPNLEKSTIHGYLQELRTKILPALGHIKLDKIQPFHITQFLNNLTKDGVRMDGKPGGYSTRSIKKNLETLSGVMQKAVDWQIINNNPCFKVSSPKGQTTNKKVKYMTLEQARVFVEAIENEPLKYKALAYVALYGGLRLEEMLALIWSDIDFKAGSIDINKALSCVEGQTIIKSTKNSNSERKITLPPPVMLLLKEYRLQTPVERVFEMNYFTPGNWLKKFILRYNKNNPDNLLPKITMHGFRHTHATLLISQKVDLRTVSGRLGHNNTTTTTSIYAHFMQSQDETASAVIDDILSLNNKQLGSKVE